MVPILLLCYIMPYQKHNVLDSHTNGIVSYSTVCEVQVGVPSCSISCTATVWCKSVSTCVLCMGIRKKR